MAKRSKGAKVAPDKVWYVEGQIPRMRPIIPERAAQQGGERAIEVARNLILTGKVPKLDPTSADDAQLTERISQIAVAYWPERRWAERLGPNNLRDALSPILKAATKLVQRLEEAPGYARGVLNKRLSRSWNATPDRSQPAELEHIEDALRLLCKSAASKSELKGTRGSREKAHVKAAVAMLVELWCDLSGDRFNSTFDIVNTPDGKSEFAHLGPRFVHDLLSAIDPDISRSEVSTALKDWSVKRHSSPKLPKKPE